MKEESERSREEMKPWIGEAETGRNTMKKSSKERIKRKERRFAKYTELINGHLTVREVEDGKWLRASEGEFKRKEETKRSSEKMKPRIAET